MLKILNNLSTTSIGFEMNDILSPDVLEFILSKGISVNNKKIQNISFNKIYLGIAAVECGADVFEVCKLLDWKDFEIFSSEVLKYHDYLVHVNYRIKNPTRQIDIIGIRSKVGLIVDCKHWKDSSYSRLLQVVKKQKERAVLLHDRKHVLGISKFYPIIVTFLQNEFQYINGVPIVSIRNLNSFLLDFDNYTQNFFTV